MNRWCFILLLRVIHTNKNPVKKKKKKTPPQLLHYVTATPPNPTLLLPSLSSPPVSSYCLFSCLHLSPFPLFCPSIFLFPSLALIRLFFVSQSWPPSCQLRQD